jgi:hypothetical protein
MDNIFL